MRREYGFEVFHATDFRARRGEFEGWSDAKAEKFINELAELIHRGLTKGLVTTLPYALFEAEYLKTPFPRGSASDDAQKLSIAHKFHETRVTSQVS
jgi:hypothetical protein